MLNFKNLKQKFHTVHIKKFELPSESRAIINNLKNITHANLNRSDLCR